MFVQAVAPINLGTSSVAQLATSTAAMAKTIAENPFWEKISAFQLVDIILMIILLGFVIYGLYFGLVRTVGSLLGVVVGAFVASHFYLVVADWAQSLFFGYDNLGKVIVFILLFALVNRLVGFAFAMLDRFVDILSIIPFLQTVNHLAGAILGFVEGALVLGLILFVASRYALVDHWFGAWLSDSKMVPYLLNFAKVLWPLLPEVLREAKSMIAK